MRAIDAYAHQSLPLIKEPSNAYIFLGESAIKALLELSSLDRHELFDALVEYAYDGNKPIFNGEDGKHLHAIFELISTKTVSANHNEAAEAKTWQ